MESTNLLTQISGELESLVAEASSSVVQVGGRHGRPGTGTVVATERVLTAAHIVEHQRELTVRDGGGNTRKAELVGTDAAADLAVLRVPGLEAKALAGGGQPHVGQLAVALGRTLSGALVASTGIASVIGGPLRTGRRSAIELVLRADVRIHPFGAGGPLLGADGRVLGIALGAVMRGMPLFVPASIAWPLAESLAAHGSTRRGYLGISAQPVQVPDRQRAGSSHEAGLLVIGMAPGSPAEQAGVLVGDIVVAFDGQGVEDHDALLALLTGDRVGKPVSIEVLRAGEARRLDVTVGAR